MLQPVEGKNNNVDGVSVNSDHIVQLQKKRIGGNQEDSMMFYGQIELGIGERRLSYQSLSD